VTIHSQLGPRTKGARVINYENCDATLSPNQLEQLWADHLKGEFETKDVDATLATMVEDAYVNHMPVNTGGRGKAALRVFYRDDFIPSWPDDLKTTTINRILGPGQSVDELHQTFTHSKPMRWFLPNVPANHKNDRSPSGGRRSVPRRQTRLRAYLPPCCGKWAYCDN
jgi:hypothetical protein